ncbi:hypothetical protein ACO0R3_003102 [Hanseniaspora guilliermondii]
MSLFALPKVINTHNTDTNDILTLLRPSESIIHRYTLSSFKLKKYKLQFIDLKTIRVVKSSKDSDNQDFVVFITNERLIFYHINLRIGMYLYLLGITFMDENSKLKTTTKLTGEKFHDTRYTLISHEGKTLIEFIKDEFLCGVCFDRVVIKTKKTHSSIPLTEFVCDNCGSHLTNDDVFLFTSTLMLESSDNKDHMICPRCTHDNSEYSEVLNNCQICESPLIYLDIPLLLDPVSVVFKAIENLRPVIEPIMQETKRLLNLSKMNTNSMNLLKLMDDTPPNSLEMGIKSIINKYEDDIKKLEFLQDVSLSSITNFLESINEIDDYLHIPKQEKSSYITLTDFFISNQFKVMKVNDLYYLYNLEVFHYKYITCQDFVDMINANDFLQIYDYNNVSYVINKDFEREYIINDYECGKLEYDNIVKDKLSYEGVYLIDLDSFNKMTYYFNNGD